LKSLLLDPFFKGEISKGIAELQHAMRLNDDPAILATLGYGYAISGNTEEAERALVVLENLSSKRAISFYHFATAY